MRYNPDDYDCSITLPNYDEEKEDEDFPEPARPKKNEEDKSQISLKKRAASKNKKSAIEKIDEFTTKYKEETGSAIDNVQKFTMELKSHGKKTIIYYDPDKFDPEKDDIDDEDVNYDLQDFWVLDD